MSEYRVLLDGGDVLVVTLEIEPGEAVEADPTSLGEALLSFLGRPNKRSDPLQLGRQVRPVPKSKRIVRPVEEDPLAWLTRTSKESLKGL